MFKKSKYQHVCTGFHDCPVTCGSVWNANQPGRKHAPLVLDALVPLRCIYHKREYKTERYKDRGYAALLMFKRRFRVAHLRSVAGNRWVFLGCLFVISFDHCSFVCFFKPVPWIQCFCSVCHYYHAKWFLSCISQIFGFIQRASFIFMEPFCSIP